MQLQTQKTFRKINNAEIKEKVLLLNNVGYSEFDMKVKIKIKI